MSKRRRRRGNRPDKCRSCGVGRPQGVRFYNGRCPACGAQSAVEQRAKTGAKLIERAKDAGTVERDGQTFKVSVLPEKSSKRPRISQLPRTRR